MGNNQKQSKMIFDDLQLQNINGSLFINKTSVTVFYSNKQDPARMINFLFCLLITLITTPSHGILRDSYKKFFDECLAETGARREDALKLFNHDFSSSEDPKIKVSLFFFCATM